MSKKNIWIVVILEKMTKEWTKQLKGPNVLHAALRDRMFKVLPPPLVYLWVYHWSTASGMFSFYFLSIVHWDLSANTQIHTGTYKDYGFVALIWKRPHRTTGMKNNLLIAWAIQKFKTTGKACKHLFTKQNRQQKHFRQNLRKIRVNNFTESKSITNVNIP